MFTTYSVCSTLIFSETLQMKDEMVPFKFEYLTNDDPC